MHAVLHRPGPESGDVGSFENGDGEILMPRNLPIGFGGLVEEDASYNERTCAQNLLNEIPESRDIGELSHLRHAIE